MQSRKISYLIAIQNEGQLPIFAAEKIKNITGLRPHKWCFILNFGDLKKQNEDII